MQLNPIGLGQRYPDQTSSIVQSEARNLVLMPFSGPSASQVNDNVSLVVKDIGSLLDLSQKNKSIDFIKKYILSHANLEKQKGKLNGVKVEFDELFREKQGLEEEIEQLASVVGELKENIAEEERKRIFAWSDLIPGIGIVEKWTSRRPERLIPFYSTILGVISIAAQTLENEQRKLNLKLGEKEELKFKLNNLNINISEKEDEIKEVKIDVCNEISHSIEILINLIDYFLIQLEMKEKILNKELLEIVEKFNLMHQNHERLKSKTNNLKNKLVELNNKKKELNNEINELERVTSKSERKIEKEEKLRTNAWQDTLPGFGFVAGLVTGNYERMIPLYSPIRGIISVVEQTVENEQRKLNLKNNEKYLLKLKIIKISNKIKRKENKLAENNAALIQMNLQKDKKDAEIAQLGRDLTRLRNASLFLKTHLHRYKLFDLEGEMRPLLIQSNLFEEREMWCQFEELQSIERVLSSSLKPKLYL